MFGGPLLAKIISAYLSPWVLVAGFIAVVLLFLAAFIFKLGDNLYENILTVSFSVVSVMIFSYFIYFSFMGALMYIICFMFFANIITSFNNSPIFSPDDLVTTGFSVFVYLDILLLLVRLYA